MAPFTPGGSCVRLLEAAVTRAVDLKAGSYFQSVFEKIIGKIRSSGEVALQATATASNVD